MKKVYIVGMVTLLVVGLLTWGIGPAIAQGEEYERITMPLSPEEGDGVYTIPSGSFNKHLDNGITEVYGPDKVRIFAARDSEASLIPTPFGRRKATCVYQVPSGSRIVHTDRNTTEFYEDETCILTVVNQSGDNSKMQIPSYQGWIESSDDWSVDELDYFFAEWVVPSDPPDPGESAVDFLFNGITPSDPTVIIQPVLEWNQLGSGAWTCAAWAAWEGDATRATPVDASEGDTIWGTLSYGTPTDWYINCYNRTTYETSALYDDHIESCEDLAVFCALEGYNIEDDDDVPGDTTFDDMVFHYDLDPVDITWVENVRSGTGLTGLGVTIYSDSKVKLNTAN